MTSGQSGPNPMGGGMPPGMSPGESFTPGQRESAPPQSRIRADRDSPTAEAYEAGLFKRLALSYVIPFGVQPPAQANPLVATLELQGQSPAEASAYGKFQFESVTDDTGKRLEFIQGAGAIKNPTRDFIPVDRRMMFAGQLYPPQDKVRIHMMFQPPDSQATRLTRLIGSLQLIARSDPQPVTVENPLQKTGQSFEDPALSSAGLQIRIQDRIESITAHVSKNVLFLKVTGPVDRLASFFEGRCVGQCGDRMPIFKGLAGGAARVCL
jgi:hypothetical protein